MTTGLDEVVFLMGIFTLFSPYAFLGIAVVYLFYKQVKRFQRDLLEVPTNNRDKFSFLQPTRGPFTLFALGVISIIAAWGISSWLGSYNRETDPYSLLTPFDPLGLVVSLVVTLEMGYQPITFFDYASMMLPALVVGFGLIAILIGSIRLKGFEQNAVRNTLIIMTFLYVTTLLPDFVFRILISMSHYTIELIPFFNTYLAAKVGSILLAWILYKTGKFGISLFFILSSVIWAAVFIVIVHATGLLF